MKNIDYKIFVPRGQLNFLRIEQKEFLIEEILTVNIHLGDDKITYWFYVNIPLAEEHYIVLLNNIKKVNSVLLIGNNPYEIYGEAEIINTHIDNRKRKKEYTVSFQVDNASKTYNNKRRKIKVNRSELMDFED